ncbi:DUF262 domain-containing protein [Nostoc sp.]|uniref:DUF262 domain-containing protein n=1 Tax=Nostoc sp. TaxID=1180 RepID=UPI002FF329E2
MTISEYCQQMKEKKIIVNHDYQRSGKIWPPAAKSYFIDTLILGFPIPKLYIYQVTDLKTRKTTKEIVDGQQRSTTILSFYNDEFKISGNSQFRGLKFSQLEEEDQSKFLNYQLGIDSFVNATPDEIRQTFKRMNSYTVPLNAQEKRYAISQGAFKWFITELSNRYAETLKSIGVFSEKELSRMDDSELLSDIIFTLFHGIERFSNPSLDKLYTEHEDEFPNSVEINNQIDNAFYWILKWEEIHKTAIMKSYNFYALLLSVIHHLYPNSKLMEVYSVEKKHGFTDDIILFKLSKLSEVLENKNISSEDKSKYSDFVKAASATTTKGHREIRFQYFCKALEPQIV